MFITHDLCVVKHISDEIMVMYMGQVVEHAKTAELFANPVHPYTKALLHAVPTIDLSKRNREGFMLRGEVTSPINPAPGCRFAPRCPYATDKCKAIPHNLARRLRLADTIARCCHNESAAPVRMGKPSARG